MQQIKLQDLKAKSPTELLAFAEDRNTKSSTWFRVVNEVPTLIMIGVVILVIVKPF